MTDSCQLMIYSFDVFDTLISRKTGTPNGIFAIVQDRLMRQFPTSPATSDFYNLRVIAEQTARAISSHEDVTYDEIYECFANQVQDAEFTLAAKSSELEVELEFIVGVQENIEIVRRHLRNADRVILISDMYLPRNEIQRLIAKCAPDIASQCPLYVSGEWRKTKSRGSLFRAVAEKEKVSFSNWTHFGDNHRSDVSVPQSLGISAHHYSKSVLSSWEKIGQSTKSIIWQRVAGSARRQRLATKSIQQQIGYAVVGPMMGSYVAWLVKQAQEKEIHKLYLLARDGYLFNALLTEFKKNCSETVEFQYVYGSRLAWRKATFENFGEAELKWSLFTFSRNSIRGISQRLGIKVEDILGSCPDLDPNEKLTAKQLSTVRKVLDDPTIVEKIQLVGKQNRQLSQDYLRQIGMFDTESVFIVDLGWGGSMQACLEKILPERTNIVGFYFGFTDEREKDNHSAETCAYSYEHQLSESNKFCHDAKFFESLASAPHGSTTGYQSKTNAIEPLLDTQGELVEQWGYDQLVQGACEFVSEHIDLLKDTCEQPYWYEFACDYLSYLDSDRVCDEFAECFGSYPFTPDSDDLGMRELGPKLTVLDAIKYFFVGPQQRAEISLWPRGSAIRSSWLVRLVMFKLPTRFVRYLVKPWMVYELLPYWLVMRLIKIIPKPIVHFLQKRIYGVKIH